MAELKDELHLLHEAAGYPAVATVLRDIKREHRTMSVSRATVHKVVTEGRLPDRATMMAFVRALAPRTIPPRVPQEEVTRLAPLWEAASRAQRQRETAIVHPTAEVGTVMGSVAQDLSSPERIERLETDLRSVLDGVSQYRHWVEATREQAGLDGSAMVWDAKRKAVKIVREARESALRIGLRAQLRAELLLEQVSEVKDEIQRLNALRSELRERIEALEMFQEDVAADLSQEHADLMRRVDGLVSGSVPAPMYEDVPTAQPLPELEDPAPAFHLPNQRSQSEDPALASSGPNPSMT